MNDISLMSDAHKDAYGFRPSADKLRHWANLPAAEFEAVQDELFAAVEASIAAETGRRNIAVAEFEAHIARMMADHGVNRETAIRWDRQAYGAENDEIGYYEYLVGLPYDYINGRPA